MRWIATRSLLVLWLRMARSLSVHNRRSISTVNFVSRTEHESRHLVNELQRRSPSLANWQGWGFFSVQHLYTEAFTLLPPPLQLRRQRLSESHQPGRYKQR